MTTHHYNDKHHYKLFAVALFLCTFIHCQTSHTSSSTEYTTRLHRSLAYVLHPLKTIAMALGEYTNLRVDRYDRVFVITMQKAPENRLNLRFAQEIIRALRDIEQELGPDSEGCVITKGNDEKFWCTGLELDESDTNPFANSDGFFPLLATLLDYPFPTIALLTGHTFGGACPFALAHDYRIMNSSRGFLSMPPVNLGLHFPGIGFLPRLKLRPPSCAQDVARSSSVDG